MSTNSISNQFQSEVPSTLMTQHNHSWDFRHPDGPLERVGTDQEEEKSEGLRTSRWDEIWQDSMMR